MRRTGRRDIILMEILKQQIKRHEGLVLTATKGTLDDWFIGYGHDLNSPITPDIAERILDHDLAVAVVEAHRLPPEFRKQLNETRARVIANMIFNMGRRRFMTFKRMVAAVEARDFTEAAAEMLDSKWAGQVSNRAVELAEIMRHGREDG